MQSISDIGGFRASAKIIPSGLILKCAKFLSVPFNILQRMSSHKILQPMNAASTSIPPVPENGSNTSSFFMGLAKFIMHLPNLAGIAEG